MQARIWTAVAVAAVAVATVAGGGNAAAKKNSETYADATGDAAAAPDVASVRVANDDTGRITIWVVFANRSGGWAAGDDVLLALDTDADDSTGSPGALGVDVIVGVGPPDDGSPGSSWGVYRWSSASGQFAFDSGGTTQLVNALNADRTLGFATEDPRTLKLAFPRALLGITRGFELDVTTASGAARDNAPESNAKSFLYVLDVGPPVVRALASSGKRGTVVRLRYTARDDNGRSREAIVVFRGRKRVATITGRFGPAEGERYFLTWRPPKRLARGAYTFCVASGDPFGNVGKASCASLRLT